MEVAPFFVDFHHFLSIFTIFYRFSRFTHFCRDLRTFSANFFGQNSLHRIITRFLHVWNLGKTAIIWKHCASFNCAGETQTSIDFIMIRLKYFIFQSSQVRTTVTNKTGQSVLLIHPVIMMSWHGRGMPLSHLKWNACLFFFKNVLVRANY